LKDRDTPYVVLEKMPKRGGDMANLVAGDAADIHALKKAGIEQAPAALVTTHDDATNIYLTKYLRSLRPDVQILSRANLDRNVSTLHRAGADFVMSYVSLGANAIFNFLNREDTLMLAEGLNIFRVKVPASLAEKSLADSKMRKATNCSVVAVNTDGRLSVNPDPHAPISGNAELIMIGTHEGEQKFLELFES